MTKKLLIASPLFILFSCHLNNESDKQTARRNVYNLVANDLCECLDKDTTNSFKKKEKNCEGLIVKKHYKQLNEIGYDTLKKSGLEIFYKEVFMNRLDKTCLKYHEEFGKDVARWEQNQGFDAIFIGTLVDQNKISNSEYEIILKEKDISLNKIFLTDRPIDVSEWRKHSGKENILVKYRIIVKEGKEFYVIKKVIFLDLPKN